MGIQSLDTFHSQHIIILKGEILSAIVHLFQPHAGESELKSFNLVPTKQSPSSPFLDGLERRIHIMSSQRLIWKKKQIEMNIVVQQTQLFEGELIHLILKQTLPVISR